MIERTDTKAKILDTAENLFGVNGFESVSLRDITSHAGVNLAAVNYHFQTKDHLIDAVIARRIEPVNARRLELLEALSPQRLLQRGFALVRAGRCGRAAAGRAPPPAAAPLNFWSRSTGATSALLASTCIPKPCAVRRWNGRARPAAPP